MRFIILLIIIILLLFVYGAFKLSGEISRKEEAMRARRYNISDRAFNAYFATKVKCKNCGHSFPISTGERAICNHCGHYVYRNKKIEFKYELQKRLKNTN